MPSSSPYMDSQRMEKMSWVRMGEHKTHVVS
jgi:hypothetical protein